MFINLMFEPEEDIIYKKEHRLIGQSRLMLLEDKKLAI